MNRLGAGAAVATLALGCGHTRQEGGCTTCGGGRPVPVVSSVQAPTPTPADHEAASPPPAVGARGGYAGVAAPRVDRFPAYLPVTPPTPAPAPVVATPQAVSVVSTADPAPVAGYMHSPGYTMLVGELQHNPRQGTWRLRYAPLDEEDRYGGCVTLDGPGRLMAGYRHGQRVRVEGELADPESREISPAFRVRDVYPLGE
jgi:hypothetical protein